MKAHPELSRIVILTAESQGVPFSLGSRYSEDDKMKPKLSVRPKLTLVIIILISLTTLMYYLQFPFPNIAFKKIRCSSFATRSCLPNPFYQKCLGHDLKTSMTPFYDADRPRKIKDILLVIVFNYPYYENTNALEYLYGRVFENILFCGSNKTSFHRFSLSYVRPLDFVEVEHRNGEWGYRCMVEAVKRNFSGTGYMHITDDVMLNAWQLHKFPRHLPWFFDGVRNSSRMANKVPCVSTNPDWWPWRSFMGKNSLDHAWKEFHDVIAKGNETQRKRVKTFLANLKSSSGKEDWVFYHPSDIWYLPTSKAAEFVGITEVFDRHKMYLEIAIPNALFGLGLPVTLFQGSYLWDSNRSRPLHFYSPSHLFLHPFKLSLFHSYPNGTVLMCEHFLPTLNNYLE